MQGLNVIKILTNVKVMLFNKERHIIIGLVKKTFIINERSLTLLQLYVY